MLKKYWPGKLTVVKNKIGYRVPNDDFLLKLLDRFDFLYSSSANISGRNPITDLDEAHNTFRRWEWKLVLVDNKRKKTKNTKLVILIVVILVLCTISAILMYFMLDETKELNENVKKLGRWSLITAIRLSNSVQSINYLLISIALDLARSAHLPTPPNAFINLEGIIQSCKNALFFLLFKNI